MSPEVTCCGKVPTLLKTSKEHGRKFSTYQCPKCHRLQTENEAILEEIEIDLEDVVGPFVWNVFIG